MNPVLYVFYFIIGGAVVCTAAYYGINGKGYWAAFVATLPVVTLIVLISIYHGGGMDAAISYAQGLILLTLPFLLFVSLLIWFIPYLGLLPSIIISICAYIVTSTILNWVRKI